ncbi:MAG: integrin alpha [Chloroflexota bacterium]
MNRYVCLVVILVLVLASMGQKLTGITQGLPVEGVLSLGDWSVEGDQQGGDLGAAVATAGDFDGDGYADVVIGVPVYDKDASNDGAVLVFFGSGSGLGDMPPDWAVGSGNQGSRFGCSVGAAGDVNQDGFDDLVVGAQDFNNGVTRTGAAFVFYGAPRSSLSATPAWSYVSDQQDSQLGVSVGAAGDVNGDGYADIIVGARWYDDGQTNEGAALVFFGSDAGPSDVADWMIEGDQSGASLGSSVATAGDVNGDGYSDVIVGAPYYDCAAGEDAGAVFVYLGSATGLSQSAGWWFCGAQAGGWLGAAVSTAGDINGDGYADVIVGAPHYDGDQADVGAMLAFYGSPSILPATPNWQAEGAETGWSFGASVGAAGDVNGGGYDDIIVGAPYLTRDQAREGGAFVFRGSAIGLFGSAFWQGEGNKSETEFGASVGAAGDVDGDGYADVIIGAPEFKKNTIRYGKALVHFGAQAQDPDLASVYLPLIWRASH